MKLLIILMLASFVCKGQDTTRLKLTASVLDSLPFDGFALSISEFSIWKDSLAATRTDSGWTIYNAPVALELLYKSYMEMQEKYFILTEIMYYQRPDGIITNWRKWSAAVKKYQELLNKNH